MSCKIKHAPKPVKPLADGETPRFTDNELSGFDSYTKEHIRATGTPIEYFSLDLKSSKRDPLYDEPLERIYKPAFKLFASVRWPAPNFMAREDGTAAAFMTDAWISRKEVEELSMPAPKPGDSLRFWNVPFFNNSVIVNGKQYDGAGFYFDVLSVADEGHLFDTPSFTTFRISIKRRTEYAPERKIFDY